MTAFAVGQRVKVRRAFPPGHKAASGRPAPRYAWVGVVLVTTHRHETSARSMA